MVADRPVNAVKRLKVGKRHVASNANLITDSKRRGGQITASKQRINIVIHAVKGIIESKYNCRNRHDA